ncbi:Ig-like domain-containing protein (plasmid) [Brevundimonas olei]|uniref:Ig-like domain-containing protein n=1 Tax=Brevundimonas olei TaxID=657642 RepID=A0ABZ2II01_9CAUL
MVTAGHKYLHSWLVAFALLIVAFSFGVGPSRVEAQSMTGNEVCQPLDAGEYRACYDNQTWTAQAGQTISGKITLRGLNANYASLQFNSSIGQFSASGPRNNDAYISSETSFTWTIPANAAPGTYPARVFWDGPDDNNCHSMGCSTTWAGTTGGNIRVTVTAPPLPPAPTAANVSVSTGHNQAVTFNPSISGVADRLHVGQPGQGTAAVVGMQLRYTPPNGFYGNATFAYSVEGPGGRSADAIATVTVAPPPAPTAGNMTVDVGYQTRTVITPPTSGVANSISVTSTPSSGQADWFYPTITYTPANGFFGNDSLQYRVNGPGGSSPTYTVTLRVAPPPAPGAGNVSASTAYQTATNIALTPTGVYSSVSKVTDPSNGSVTISGTTATYTPAAGFYGTDTFTYRATGPGGNSPTRTVTVTVGTPAAPTAANQTQPVGYEASAAFNLSVGGEWSSASIVSQPSKGSVSLSGARATYTAGASSLGSDTFTWRATGPGGNSSTATVTMNIANPPAPGAADVSANAVYETAKNIALAPSGVYTSVAVVAQPGKGSVTITGTTARYVPAASFIGTDTFTYRATGPGGNSPTRTVSVTVSAPPAPGAAAVTASTAYETATDIALQPSGVWSSLAVVAQPASGTVTISGTTARFTPAAGFYGTATWTYRAMGAGGNSDPATVTVTVGLPPAPGAGNVSSSTAYETAVAIPLTPTGVWSSIEKMSDPANGSVSISGTTATYTPALGFYGTNTFGYRAVGPGGNSATRTVTVTVAVPPPPLAADATLNTAYQTAGTRVLPVSGVLTSVSIVDQPGRGSASITGTTLTYTPSAGVYGADSLTYRATGPGGSSAIRTVSIAVGNPSAPGAANISSSTAYNAPKAVALQPSGVWDSVSIVAQPSNGSVSLAGTTATYTPTSGFIGTDNFTYRATGPGGDSPTRTVTMTVDAPPAPGAAAVTASTAYETATDIALQPSGVWSSLAVVAQPASGTVTISGTTARFTPAAGFYGTATWTYRAMGAGGNSDPATVTVTVGLPPAPGAGNVSSSTAYETAVAIPLTPTGVWSSIEKMSDPANGSVSISGTTATYTPALGFYGTNTFGYRAVGPGGNSATRTVTVTVALPAAPTAADTTLSAGFQTAGTRVLPVAGVLTSVSVVDQPAHGSASITGTTLTYTPASGYHGPDALTYQATGPGGASAVRNVAITVATPGAPTVQNASLTTPYETAGSVSLSASGFSPVLSITEQPSHGSAVLSGANVTYTPNAGYFGPDAFKVVATNAGGTSAAATVSVTVGLPAAPGLVNASLTTAFEKPGHVDLSPSGVWSSLEVVSQGANGSASISGQRLTYTPAAGYYGADIVTVRAVGPGGASSTATVAVTVAVPGAPAVSAASLTTAYGVAGSTDLIVTGVFDQLEIVTQGANGSASISGQRLTYTPNSGHYGADVVTVRAVGPGGASAPASVTVTVGNPPAPVAAASLDLAVAYETAGSVKLQASGVVSGFVLASQPAHGTATLSGDTVTYTPAAEFFGADSFTFRATGPGGASAAATVSVTVGLPAAPVATAAVIVTPYETQGTVNLSGQGVYSAVQLASSPAHGTATINSGVATYTPNAEFFGSDSFTFTVTGPGGTSAPATVSVTVGLPGRPVASPDSIATDYETAGTVTLRATGIHDRFAIIEQPKRGSVSLSGAVVTYTPSAGYFGADSFTFTAEGPGGVSNPATIAVTVGLPDAPKAADIAVSTAYETATDIPLQPSGVWSSLAVVAQPASGAVTINGTTARFTPAAGFYGTATWTYRAMGAGGNSAPATVTVNVGLPPAPVAAASLDLAVAYETAGSVKLQASGVVSGFVLASQPAHGTATLSGDTVTYTPAAEFFGADSFTFRATGPGGASAAATVSVTVGLPAAPVATAAVIVTPYETQGTVNLSGQGVYSAVQLASSPAHGTATINSGVATYTPNAEFFGSDSFTFTVTGPGGTSAPATVSVTVGLPGRPVASPDSIATDYETAGTVTLRATGIHDRFAIIEQPKRGSVSLSGAVVTYTPSAGYFGADSFTFTAEGPGGVSNPATIAVTVGLPDAPKAADIAVSTAYETAASVKLDGTGVFNAFVLASQPRHGTALLNGDVVTYTPSAGFYGSDAFTFTVSGPGGVSAPAAISVTVGLPNAPIASAAAISTAYETAGSVKLGGTGVFDALTLASQPRHGTAALNGDVVTYTPSAGFYGADAFTFTVSGPGGVSAPATVTVKVGLPAMAIVRDVQVSTPMDVAVEFSLDAEGVYSSLEVVTAPEHGAVTIEGETATYKPSAAFFGTDTFSYVAVGPAGKSEAATVTITVEGGPPPEAEDMEKTGLSGEPIVFDVTQGLQGGPFTAIRLLPDSDIASNEASGRVEVQGLRVVFTPAAGWTGNRTFRIEVQNRFGWSEPARITAIVNPRPVTGETIEVETWAGRPVEVDLTQNAKGGPFIGAQLLSASTDRAEVVLVSDAPRHMIKVTPKGAAGAVVEVRYTLANEFAVSAEGLVRVRIKERPDPSRNAEVTGLINAQTQSAYRFSASQVSNVMRRLESIHGDQTRRNNVGLSLVPMEHLEALPGDNPISDRQRDYMIAAGMAEHVGGSQGEERPSMNGATREGNLSWWVSGAIDLGLHRKGEDREGFNFTTDGLTAGADFGIGAKLVLGGGIGYGRDSSRIGINGTESKAEAFSGFVYGSWQPRRGAFVDGVVGYTDMAFKAVRWSEEAGAHLLSDRDGEQLFGAVSAGWEHRGRRLYISPYGRVEFANVTLGGFTESEADLWSLEFETQKSTRVIAALGVHGDYLFRWRSGDLSPTFRAEYRHELKNSGSAAIRYADWDDSPRYVLEPSAYDDRNLVMGVGVKWESVSGSRFSVEYEASAFNHTAQSGRWQVSYSRKY